MIRLATVFSGIGAIEFALKRLNLPYEIVFACDNGERDVEYDKEKEQSKIKSLKTVEEKWKYAENLYSQKTKTTNYVKQSYMCNYPELPNERFFQDIVLLDGNDFKGKVDLFVGGSPCQSFSSIGYKAGLEDTRGTLFYEFARLVKEIQPKVFIYENVRNLLVHDKGKTWTIIQRSFDELGYKYKFAILNAADYGIPQTRNRLFVVGYKTNGKKDFEFPPKKKDLNFVMSDFLEDNCRLGGFKHDEYGNLVLDKTGGKVDTKYYLTPLLYAYVMRSGTKNWKVPVKINLDVARTLLKTMGNRHRSGVDNYVSKNRSTKLGDVRMLTEREAHRLMGFTDDYKICVSRAQAYKQAGNSIVVDVLMEIVKSLMASKLLR